MQQLQPYWQRFLTWWRPQSTRTKGLVIGGVALVILLACGAISQGGTHTTSTAQASNHPKATATPNAGPAILGGTLDAFTAKYGAAKERTKGVLYGFQTHCGSGEADCEQVSLFPGSDGKPHALLVSFSTPTSQPWGKLTDAESACQAAFPVDAKLITQNSDDRSGLHIGWYAVYQSNSLANVFPAATFNDSTGNHPPGTFDVLYLSASGATYSDCQIAVGASGAA